jgi:hypothetical protein
MTPRSWVAVSIGLLVVLALSYGAFTSLRSPADQCYACSRPAHAHSRTIALVNGRPRVFCCPACALSQREQSGKPAPITQLTSFSTGEKLSPAGAFVVKGSDVNMCEHASGPIDPDHRPADLQYDRCSPSLIAFGRRDQASAFARQHGGQVEPFAEVMAASAK